MSAETEALADAGPSLDLAALTEVIFGHVGPLTWTSRTEELPQVQLAKAILASDWLAAHTAAAKREGARGIRFRVEVACDGYAHLMDEDVPSNESDLAAYQQGAHDAAEAIRAVLIEGGA